MLLYRAAVRIDAPPERVWVWLSDWSRSSRWIMGTTVDVVGDRSEGAGTRTRAVTRIAGIKLVDEMTVTRWDPPWLITVHHHRKPLLGDAWFEIVPVGGASSVEWVEDLELPFGALGELAGAVLRAPVEWSLRRSLRKLKRLVEASP